MTSYKVGYSTLRSQAKPENNLRYLHYKIDWNIYKHLIKHSNYKRYMIVRHPYNRFLSLFNDKFRKQPQRILDNLHTWENVHQCLYPFLNIDANNLDTDIAEKFLAMSIADFLKILPKVVHLDEHFMPQHTSSTYYFLNRFPLKMRVDRCFRMENDLDELSGLTGLNFGKVSNSSDSKKLKSSLYSEDLVVLNKIYATDFKLGNYQME